MADPIGMATQLAGSTLRFGWYFGIHLLLAREARRREPHPRPATRAGVADRELIEALRDLLVADAAAVSEGLYPPAEPAGSLAEHLESVRAMFADLPEAMARRSVEDTQSAARAPGANGVPDYYRQDFHFQTGGYLSEDSARLYDVQVETLFYGTAQPMRRAALRPIAAYMRGRDQRRTTLLDVACGTGRFLRELRLAYPGLRAAGLDLSQAYLEEARRHLGSLRPVDLIAANAEAMPLPDASQDIVTCIFLFHELPGEVRRRVTAEIARLLKPGGLLVFVESLQLGDRPSWDGLLRSFPALFHEPYYAHYIADDLDAMFTAAGLGALKTSHAFLSKVMARCKR